MIDALRALSVIISISEMCVLLAYYIPLAGTAPFWQWVHNSSSVRAIVWEGDYVSDLLMTDGVYRHVVTNLVGLHLVLCALFVVRLNRDWGSCILVMELTLMAAAWLGWSALTARYRVDDSGISWSHITGTAVFIASNLAYFVLMVYNVYSRFPRAQWTRTDDTMLLLAVGSLVLCLLSGVYFITAVFSRVASFGWLFEHASFIFFVGAHLFLFVLEGLLQNQVVDEGMYERMKKEGSEALFQDVTISPRTFNL